MHIPNIKSILLKKIANKICLMKNTRNMCRSSWYNRFFIIYTKSSVCDKPLNWHSMFKRIKWQFTYQRAYLQLLKSITKTTIMSWRFTKPLLSTLVIIKIYFKVCTEFCNCVELYIDNITYNRKKWIMKFKNDILVSLWSILSNFYVKLFLLQLHT